jgi:hypothetical protein
VESGRITLIKEENVLRDRISVINLNDYRIKHLFSTTFASTCFNCNTECHFAECDNA